MPYYLVEGVRTHTHQCCNAEHRQRERMPIRCVRVSLTKLKFRHSINRFFTHYMCYAILMANRMCSSCILYQTTQISIVVVLQEWIALLSLYP